MEQKIEPFIIVGISTVTTNENGQSANDLGMLWRKFYTEDISSKIPGKESEEVYAVYTNYESDYRGKYLAVIGQKVKAVDQLPSDLMSLSINGGKYLMLTAKGKMPEAIIQCWQEIWKKDKEIKRKYSADFEVYGAKSQNSDESAVEIFIAVK